MFLTVAFVPSYSPPRVGSARSCPVIALVIVRKGWGAPAWVKAVVLSQRVRTLSAQPGDVVPWVNWTASAGSTLPAGRIRSPRRGPGGVSGTATGALVTSTGSTLSASPRTVTQLVLGQTTRPVMAGLIAGAALAAALATAVLATPFGALIAQIVHVTDPVAYLASLGLIVAVCLLAAWIPAARAAKVDPMRTLRQA